MPGDITYGSGTSWFGQNLTDFVLNGTIAESRVDDMAQRILASWYLLQQDSPSYPQGRSLARTRLHPQADCFLFTVSFNVFSTLDEATNEHVDVQDDHYKVVVEEKLSLRVKTIPNDSPTFTLHRTEAYVFPLTAPTATRVWTTDRRTIGAYQSSTVGGTRTSLLPRSLSLSLSS